MDGSWLRVLGGGEGGPEPWGGSGPEPWVHRWSKVLENDLLGFMDHKRLRANSLMAFLVVAGNMDLPSLIMSVNTGSWERLPCHDRELRNGLLGCDREEGELGGDLLRRWSFCPWQNLWTAFMTMEVQLAQMDQQWSGFQESCNRYHHLKGGVWWGSVHGKARHTRCWLQSQEALMTKEELLLSQEAPGPLD